MRRALLSLALATSLTAFAAPAQARPAPKLAKLDPARAVVVQYASRPGAGGAREAAVARRLRALGLTVRGFQRLPFLVGYGDRSVLRRAGRVPGVIAAHRLSGRFELLLDRSVPVVFGGAQAQTWAAGADGAGVNVAVLDTGIDGLHPDLRDKVVRNVEFAYNHAESPAGAAGAVPDLLVATECPAPCNTDTQGHGTHVAGTIAGGGEASQGRYRGVAPGAGLVGLSISAQGLSAEFYVLAGLDYLLAHPELRVRAVNNSWTLHHERFDPDHPVNQALKMLHDRGVTMVFAAGNDGPNREQAETRNGIPEGASDCSTKGSADSCRITAQSVAPWALSVAAGAPIRGPRFSDQRLSDFSSRGDPRPQRAKGGLIIDYTPTVTAPGSIIMAALTGPILPALCLADNAVRCVTADPRAQPFYTAISGTSMASPHVAGAVAALQSAARIRLGRDLTPTEVEQMIVAGAKPLGGVDAMWNNCEYEAPPFSGPCGEDQVGFTAARYERWQVGAGMLDVAGSVAALERLVPPAPAPVVVQVPGPPSQADIDAAVERREAARRKAAAKKRAAARKRAAAKRRAAIRRCKNGSARYRRSQACRRLLRASR